MNPVQPDTDCLTKNVRSTISLWRAWNHVKPRGLRSKNPQTRAETARFAENEPRSIRLLQTRLRNPSFTFAQQRGAKKKRGKGKAPRVFVISSIEDRVILRSLLNTCQSRSRRLLAALGRIPEYIATPTSVGGIEDRGTHDAVRLITGAIEAGAKWFIRSDIQDFFPSIPKGRIRELLNETVQDKNFVSLFMTALETDLANANELKEEGLYHLFPVGSTGVPQGSSLSALCGNIILQPFDAMMNGRGITTVRYLDDFVILGKSKVSVEQAWQAGLKFIESLDMRAHDPQQNSDKASMGEIKSGFDFLSIHFTDREVYPSAKAHKSLLASIRDTIKESKKTILAAQHGPRRKPDCYVQTLALIDSKIRGWGDAFSPTTLRVKLNQIDTELAKEIDDYRTWFERKVQAKQEPERRRMWGIATLRDSPVPKSRRATR
ncbi:MAG: reverse transcriptase domain-containing protein [Beijerinckiaceae bacterium]